MNIALSDVNAIIDNLQAITAPKDKLFENDRGRLAHAENACYEYRIRAKAALAILNKAKYAKELENRIKAMRKSPDELERILGDFLVEHF